MDFPLRRQQALLLAFAAQLALVFVGTHVHTQAGWRICLSLIAAISLVAWLALLRRRRMLTNTPTSLISSAAQGYVELQGRGRPLGGLPVLSPITQLPCLWYRFRVERREGDKWVNDSSGESDASFLLEDGTGTCVVDPEGAEIIPVHHDQWLKDGYRYNQWTILEHDAIHAMGAFRTESTADVGLTVSEEVGQLLAEWKEDKPQLLKRFDLDKSGDIDLQEWDLARAEARREVDRRRGERIDEASDLHLMNRPRDGRLYLISALSEDKLVRHYTVWAWAHVAIFLGALAAVAKVTEMVFSR